MFTEVRRKVGTIVCLSLLSAYAASACAAGVDPTSPSSTQIITVDGYPLDRTLEGLVAYPDNDVVLLVDDVSRVGTDWTTADGKQPMYITEKRPPTEEEGSHSYLIETHYQATVSRVVRGSFASTNVTFRLVGGTIGNVEFHATEEVAPDPDRVRGALLLAGPMAGGVLQPAFAYSVDTHGTATSLLSSASSSQPVFHVDALIQKLSGR